MTGNELTEIEEESKKKLSHKKWKALQKKLKRKAKRQEEAQLRDEKVDKEIHWREFCPDYQAYLAEQERLKQQETERNELQRQWKESMWLEREKIAHAQWLAKKDWEEREKRRLKEEEKRIKEEWEQRQQKEKEEEEQREMREKERKEKQLASESQWLILDISCGLDFTDWLQEALLKEATSNVKTKDGDTWHNPLAPPGVERQVEKCTFFIRTGACRFGNRCSRFHPDPESSCVLMFPGMYTHFALDQSTVDEYDTDIALEYEDKESYQHFKDFYDDVLPELKTIGKVKQFKVCCNFEPHLRGNVYVQYKREEDAQEAVSRFNGRWYGGRQVTCEFTNIVRWKQAICGQFHQRKCPKGRSCNFLHVFRNPRNEFWEADRDNEFTERRFDRNSERYQYDRSYRSSRHGRSRSRSRSPYYRSYRSSRSPSRARRHRSNSRSPSKSRKHSSRSPSKSRRHNSRSPSKYRRHSSRSPSKSRRHSSRSPSKYRRHSSRSPSKSRRHSSRSPKSRRYGSRSPSKSRRHSSRSPSKSRRYGSRSPSKSRRHSSRSPSKSRRYGSRSPSKSRRDGLPLKSRHHYSRSPSTSRRGHSRSKSPLRSRQCKSRSRSPLDQRSKSGSISPSERHESKSPPRINRQNSRSRSRSNSYEGSSPIGNVKIRHHKRHKHNKKGKKSKDSDRKEVNGNESPQQSGSMSSSGSPDKIVTENTEVNKEEHITGSHLTLAVDNKRLSFNFEDEN